MNAALAEVAVQRPDIAVLVDQLFEIAQVRAEFFGRHRGILPAFVILGHAGHFRGRAETLFAQVPDQFFLRRVRRTASSKADLPRCLKSSMHLRAFASASSLSLPPNSTSSHACPSGMKFMSGGCSPFFFM